MIEVKDLNKTYKASGVEALKGISFKCSKGISCLLGPNGAGKTTAVKIMAGLLKPSKGTVIYNNKNIIENREQIQKNMGYVGQFAANSFQYRLTAKENLEYFGKLMLLSKAIIKSQIKYFSDLFKINDFINQ